MNDAHTSGDLRVAVLGIGVLGPGLPDWTAARALLIDPSAWTASPTVVAPATRLPPAERRRAGTIVKLGIVVADQACTQAGIDTSTLATVFTASSGDGANCNALCEALATPQRLVSPTRFTNSVHNASAGYWHIANASRAPSTSLCAHDAGFGAGLLEALSQCVADARPVLLVAADTPYPEPLNAARPLPDSFATALLLAPAGTPGALATLAVRLDTAAADPCPGAGLDRLRRSIPAARSLTLLSALAAASASATSDAVAGPGGVAAEPVSTVIVDYLPDLSLRVTVTSGACA